MLIVPIRLLHSSVDFDDDHSLCYLDFLVWYNNGY